MIIFPAIDLFGGRVVKLDSATHRCVMKDYGAPAEVATRWVKEGATHFHVVDLDGALETGQSNRAWLGPLGRLGVDVWFGGGLRDRPAIEECLLKHKVSRVIVGTRAIGDSAWFSEIQQRFGPQIIVAIDSMNGRIVIRGWQETHPMGLIDFVQRAGSWSIDGFLFTNVAVEGREGGVDWTPIEEVLRATKRPIVFSGGVTTIDEVRRFRDVGAQGLIIGSALYSGRISLREAIEAAR